jgi:WD40 repeat protein
LTTAWSGYAHMYDAASSRLMYQFQQHGGLVDAGFSPDGQHVATACEDGNAWVWDLAQANSPPMQLPQGNHIEEIAFSTDGRRLAVGSRGGHARVWDLFPPEHGVRRLPGHDVEWVDFDQSGQRALVLSTRQPSNLGVYEVSKAKLISTANLRPGQARYARFSPDGHRVLAGNSSALLVLDADTGRPLFSPLQPAGRIYDARWSPDGKLVLAAASSAGVVAWDAVTGKVARTYRGTNAVTALALSRDGLRLATAQDDRTVQLWETLTGKRINSSISTPGPVHQLEFSPDGKRLALATGNATEGLVEVFDIASGLIVGRPLVHRETVNEFAFSSDGRWLATACDDHSARVWDGDTGQPVSPWLPQGFETRNVSFSPDSTRLVTLTRRGEARLWSAATGEPITVPILYPRNTGTGHVVFSPDGLGLLLCRGGNEAWLRDLRPETAKVEELRLLAQVLSCTRFDPAAGMVPLDEAGLNRAWDQLRALHLGAN